jgi:hypothetical protein
MKLHAENDVGADDAEVVGVGRWNEENRPGEVMNRNASILVLS